MRRLTWCLLAMCAFTQGKVGVAAQPGRTGTVQGVLLLADTGRPAAGATVSLRPVVLPQRPLPDAVTGDFIVRDEPHGSRLYATAGADGRFEIDGVTPGDFFVFTYLEGYVSQNEYTFTYPGSVAPDRSGDAGPLPGFVRRIHVAVGGAVTLRLLMERGGSITGTVHFRDGGPAHTGKGPADEVAVSAEVKTREGKYLRAGGAAHTDATGHYRLSGLVPGGYVVFAGLPITMVPVKGGLEGQGGPLLYAPGVVRASRARVVEVQGRESNDGVDIELPVQGLHTIAGKVVTREGGAVDQGIVRVYPTGEPEVARTGPLGVHGEFRFEDVMDDDYTVSVEFVGATEFVGLTEDKTGVRMRTRKAPYATVTQEVRVAGQDAPPVVFHVRPASP